MRNKTVTVFLLFLLFFHIICNYLWIKKDYFSFSPEKFTTLSLEHELYLQLQNKSVTSRDFLGKWKGIVSFIFNTKRLHLRIIPFYTALLNSYLGENINNAILSNIPFLLLAILFIFLLGRELFSKETGLLASFIISFYPSFFGASRSYGVDFAGIALLAATFYFLFKVSEAAATKYLIALGAMFMATILITPRMAVFLIGPLLYMVYKTVRSKSPNRVLKTLIVFTFSLILAFPWWGPRAHLWCCFMPKVYILQLGNFFKSPPGDTFSYAVKNYFMRAAGHISPLFGLAFVIALFSFAIKRMRYRAILAIFLLTPCFILPVFVNNFNRYFFPFFIGFALITAIWLAGIRRRILKYILIFAIFFLSVLQFFDLSFGNHLLPPLFNKVNEAIEENVPEYEPWARPPGIYDEAAAAKSFFDSIYAYKKGNLQNTNVLLTGRCFDIGRGIFEYIFFVNSNRYMVTSIPICESPDYQSYDFIVLMTYKPEGKINCDVPDIEFLKSFDCRKNFVLYRYCPGPLHPSAPEREKMYRFFKMSPVLDYRIGKIYAYYLCINPKMKNKKGASR